jgi:hypothetical protein
MAGESLRSSRLDTRGLAADRVHFVTGPEGRLGPVDVPRLARWSATYPFNPDGAIVAEGAPPYPILSAPGGGRSWRWGDPRLGFALERDLGRPIELTRDLETPRAVFVAATEPPLPELAGVNLYVDLPLESGSFNGQELTFRDGVRLKLVASRGDGPGIEARVVTAGRIVVGEPVELG